jgi:1,4-alpha-glucan branching enzyme
MVSVEDGVAYFRFFRPSAQAVYLVGDFNQWRAREVAMRRDREGYWQASIRLPRGIYRFRYWADGQWFTDYAAFGIEQGPRGSDSIVRVDDDATGGRTSARPAPRDWSQSPRQPGQASQSAQSQRPGQGPVAPDR